MGGSPDNVELLREFLAETDVPCPNCRYNLRALREAACQECGDPLALVLSGRAPKFKASMAAGLPLTMGSGLFFFLTLGAVVYGSEDSMRAEPRTITALAVATAVCTVAAVAFWRRQRAMGRLPLGQIRAIAVIAWVFTICMTVVLVMVVRHG